MSYSSQLPLTQSDFNKVSWWSSPLLWRTVTAADLTTVNPSTVGALTEAACPSVWLYGNSGTTSTDPMGNTLYVIGNWKLANMANWTTTASTATFSIWYGFNADSATTVWSPVSLPGSAGPFVTPASLSGGAVNLFRFHGLPMGRYRIVVQSLTIPANDSLEIWVQRNR